MLPAPAQEAVQVVSNQFTKALRKGKIHLQLSWQSRSSPDLRLKASYSHGWKFNHMISREFVVQLLFLDFVVSDIFNIRYNSFVFSLLCFWVHIKPQFKYMWKQKYQNNGSEQSYRDSQDSLLKKKKNKTTFWICLYFCVTTVQIKQFTSSRLYY